MAIIIIISFIESASTKLALDSWIIVTIVASIIILMLLFIIIILAVSILWPIFLFF